MKEFIGILIICNSLVVSFYWVVQNGTHKAAVITLCTLAAFIGLVLFFSDRITELSMGGSTIKTKVKQVTADANEVSKLKDRVEGQSATVDLVAKEAADAKQLLEVLTKKNLKAEEKLLQLDKSINEGNRAVKDLQFYTHFHSTVLAAQADSRRAFDQLLAWSRDSSFLFQNASVQAAQTIIDQHASPIFISNTSVPWNDGTDPEKLSLPEIITNWSSAPPHLRRCILEFVCKKRTDIPKSDRLQFLVDVLKTDTSLQVIEYAGRYFAQETGDKFKPIAIEKHLQWWKENKDSIE